MFRFDADTKKTRAEASNLDLSGELYTLARLLDRLTPDYRDPERFYLQKNALVFELKKLAQRITVR
jgi:hypothetical protein